MPARLRPTADIAADAILVGDPGRALALAQTLLVAPKMSNHARGLWGYSGNTHAGAAHDLAAGARDVRLVPEGPAEVAEVAESLNSLAAALEKPTGASLVY